MRELCRYRLGYGAVTGLEPRLWVGALASFLGVREVEAKDGDTPRGQRLADVHQ